MDRKVLVASGVVAVVAALSLAGGSSRSLPSWTMFRFKSFLGSVLQRLLRAVTPPRALLMSQVTSFLAARAVHLVCKYRFADFLHDGPLSAAEVAAKASTDPATTERLMKFLAVQGIFQQVGEDAYANTPASDLMRSDHPASVRPLVLHMRLMDHASEGFEAALLDGSVVPFKASFKTDENIWGYLARPDQREERELFDHAMVSGTRGELDAILADYPWKKHGKATVIDVGGGIGHLTAALLKAHPFRGIVFDIDVKTGQEFWQTNYAEDLPRVQFLEGSFFGTVPTGGNLYILKHILHDWSDSEATKILVQVAEAMKASPDSTTLLIEGIYDSPPAVKYTANLDLLMLAIGGKERSVKEFQALCTPAGLKITKVVPLRSRFAVIEVKLR